MWLVVGANGQLGRCVTELLQSNDINYAALGHLQLDVTNFDAVEKCVEDLRPKIIVNAAAWTAVDDAEEHEEDALLTNANGPTNLVSAASQVGAKLIHLSTDYVFDGQAKVPYKVTSPTKPMNAYGRTKLAGENALRESPNGDTCIVRTAWLFSEHGKNFAKTMTVRALRGEVARVVDDQLGQPTSAHDVAQLILDISRVKEMPPIAHGTNAGQATWFQFAREIYSQLGADPALVSPVDTAAFPTVAKRPAYSVLDHSDFTAWGLQPMQNWQLGLSDSIENIRMAIQKETSL